MINVACVRFSIVSLRFLSSDQPSQAFFMVHTRCTLASFLVRMPRRHRHRPCPLFLLLPTTHQIPTSRQTNAWCAPLCLVLVQLLPQLPREVVVRLVVIPVVLCVWVGDERAIRRRCARPPKHHACTCCSMDYWPKTHPIARTCHCCSSCASSTAASQSGSANSCGAVNVRGGRTGVNRADFTTSSSGIGRV